MAVNLQSKSKYLTMKKIFLGFLGTMALFMAVGQSVATTHKVAKGETVYSISKQYGLKVKDLLAVNPGLQYDFHVKVGQELFIPATIEESRVTAKVKEVPSTPEIQYKDEDSRVRVRPTEAENAMATINNEPPMMEKPKVATSVSTPAAPAVNMSLRTTSSNAAQYPAIFGEYFAHGYKAKRNRGAANYLEDKTSGNQYLAFYNDAESGSVIKVTNMMNKKTVYVKVVGKVPPADASKEIILKLSNKAAHDLGALDEKFLVEVTGCTN